MTTRAVPALVIGDLNLARCLGRHGIAVDVATWSPEPGLARSRFVRRHWLLPPVDGSADTAVAALAAYAATQPEPPVLFCQGDDDLMLVSRHRDMFAGRLRMLLPSHERLEDCVDKGRFAEVAERLRLPVPPTLIIARGGSLEEARRWSHFPAVLKPTRRTAWFGSHLQRHVLGAKQKAIRVASRNELLRYLPAVAEHNTDFVLQREVAGGEDRIVSYHAYVRSSGETVAEFTGRKLRTEPRSCGMSAYVEITRDEELLRLGRDVMRRLELHGVVKIDFKRDARSGELFMLEVNPRFNLWHLPGAIAGVDLPKMVYDDLLAPGSARGGTARPGVRWMAVAADLRAMREHIAAGELGVLRWLWQLARADVREDLSWSDPLPSLERWGGAVMRRLPRWPGRTDALRNQQVSG
jgi:predicted ATP-grasp superfamily ATP-dependent carboligase